MYPYFFFWNLFRVISNQRNLRACRERIRTHYVFTGLCFVVATSFTIMSTEFQHSIWWMSVLQQGKVYEYKTANLWWSAFKYLFPQSMLEINTGVATPFHYLSFFSFSGHNSQNADQQINQNPQLEITTKHFIYATFSFEKWQKDWIVCYCFPQCFIIKRLVSCIRLRMDIKC